jgi:hypothetical protein
MALSDVPLPARQIGFLGLIPFAAAPLGAFLLPDPERFQAAQAGLFYGAVILTFLGAAHWGLALAGYGAQGSAEGAMTRQRAWLSVAPCLVAWLALLMVPTVALATLIAAFAVTYIAERRGVEAGALPAWYMSLRLPLTLGALASLGALLVFSLTL